MQGTLIRINKDELVRLKIFYSDPTVDKQKIDLDKLYQNLKTLLQLKLAQETKDRTRADVFRCASLQFAFHLEPNDERTFINVKSSEGKYERLSVLPVNIVVCLEEFPPAGGRYMAPRSILADILAPLDILQLFKTGRRDISSLK